MRRVLIASFFAGFLGGRVSALFAQPENIFRAVNSGGLLTQTDQRAPASSDKGVLWFYKDGTTIHVYVKDWISGDWRGPVDF